MEKCWSPITPLVALVGIEIAVFAALLGWSLLAWSGLLASGPAAGVILGAIIVIAALTLSLPVVHKLTAHMRRQNCADGA